MCGQLSVFFILTASGRSRHCRCGPKSAFVRSTPLATVLGVGPPGRDVPLADICRPALDVCFVPILTNSVEIVGLRLPSCGERSQSIAHVQAVIDWLGAA